MSDRIHYIDSHTEGEPTRVLMSGLPDLGNGPVSEQLERLKQQDWLRQCAILEPRGWDALVGAVLCKPAAAGCAAGVIFINNAGYLNMCGHGTIGLAVTLYHQGMIGLGKSKFETPVGIVEVDLLDANTVAVENVRSYRLHKDLTIDVPGLGQVTGDVAWGGNWFFLAHESPCTIELANLPQLTAAAGLIKAHLLQQGILGDDGREVDHVEFFGPAADATANSRNYVYCPGGAYDRSPCGTGTSAKVACLAADGLLAPSAVWVQESIIGSRFEASFQFAMLGGVIPRIVARAFLCSEGTLIRDEHDPYRNGI